VFEKLSNLDTSKASGPDGISCMMLKHTASSIGPILTKLFNLSIRPEKVLGFTSKSVPQLLLLSVIHDWHKRLEHCMEVCTDIVRHLIQCLIVL